MSRVKRKLFVMGGGGFAMEPDNLRLDRYLLSLSHDPRPKICFVGTASGDSESYTARFYQSYRQLQCTPTHLSLFKPPTQDLQGFLADQDIVHVGGGSTKNLLCLWRDWGLDGLLRQAYEDGLVLSGVSAGMICWFEFGTTDSFGPLAPLECLGWIPGSASPHFDGEKQRRPVLIESIRSGKMPGGIALDDGVGALFENEKLVECVSSRPNAQGLWFESGSAAEKKLDVRRLP